MLNVRMRAALLLMDCLLFIFALFAAFYLRFEMTIPYEEWHNILYFAPWGILLLIFSFVSNGIYNIIWRYASIREILIIIRAVAILAFGIAFFDYILPQYRIPRSVSIMTCLFLIASVGGSRIGWRVYTEWKWGRSVIKPRNIRKTLIIGAGNAGIHVAKELLRLSSKLTPIGFVDDDYLKAGKTIHGLKVLGNATEIPAIAGEYSIEEIIIAMPSASGDTVRNIVEICKKTNAHVKILPSIHELVSGKITISKLRNVEVEDLLRREPVRIDFSKVAAYLSNKVVIVTGAGGSIGSELCRQIARIGPKCLFLMGHGENSIHTIEHELLANYPDVEIKTCIVDIKNRFVIERLFSENRPHAVFHAAAHKHVPLMERQPEEALKNNAWGTKILAENAVRYGTEYFVLISSDKAVKPSSAMGASKGFAELILQHYAAAGGNTRFAAVRFGNVLGSRGSVIPVFKQQIARGGPVTVTHPDMVRFFMTIPEAVALVLQAGAMSEGGEIFVLDMGEPVRIYDLATDLIRLSGLEPRKDIEIVLTGIRPGEKLYEELTHNGETLERTSHNRIMKISHSSEDFEKLKMLVNRFITMNDEEIYRINREEAVRWLEKVNREYQWNKTYVKEQVNELPLRVHSG